MTFGFWVLRAVAIAVTSQDGPRIVGRMQLGGNGWLAPLEVVRASMEFVAIVWQWLCARLFCRLGRSRSCERNARRRTLVASEPMVGSLTAPRQLQIRLVELRDQAVRAWITAVGWWIPGKQSLVPIHARSTTPLAGRDSRSRKPSWS